MERVLDLIDPSSNEIETLPLLNATNVTFVDDKAMFFTRYGLETSSDNARMYQGGTMSQLWHWQRGDAEATRLAESFQYAIKSPMWFGDRIWFVSDKSGYDNLWSMTTNGEEIKQHSRYENFAIRTPQLSSDGIVYQQGADICRFSPATGQSTKVNIHLSTDEEKKRTRWIKDPINQLSSMHQGAEGKRVAITARGRIAEASPGPLRRIEIGTPDLARARGAIMGTKGKWIYTIIDREEQNEIWRYSADGKGKAKSIKTDISHRIWGIDITPDGNWLVYGDNQRQLWLLNLKTNSAKIIDRNTSPGDDTFGDYAWSPNSALLAYRFNTATVRSKIKLYALETGKLEALTTAKYTH
jgi:tricorn protease